MKLSVKLDIAHARQSLGLLQKQVDAGALRAIDRVATTLVKEASDEIGANLNLKKAAIKAGIGKRAPYGRQRFIRDIEATGKPVPIGQYAANQTKKGATFKVKRGAARKVYRAKGNAGFIIDRYGRNVFVRVEADPKGPRKGRIRKVFGPSVSQYFRTRFVRDRMQRVAAERWPVEFQREMRYRQGKAGLL